MSMTVPERCELLHGVLRTAGLRAGVSGPSPAWTHVVVGTGLKDTGYYRAVPALGTGVRIYFVPVTGSIVDLGTTITPERAAGRILDHMAGVLV